MPGVMGPVPGGPRLAEVADLLRALARRQPVAGLDLVEVAPGFDTTGHITCIGAGRLILTLLGAAWAPRSV
jgi:agmatinase